MKKVLILSYYYPPSIGVAAYRPLSFAKDFHQHGFLTTVITRHWYGGEKVWEDYQKENTEDIKIVSDENSKTIYLPYKIIPLLKFTLKGWVRKTGLSKLIHLILAFTGYFQTEINGYACFKKYLYDHLEVTKYDLMIVATPPLNLVRLAYETNKKFNIPFVVDFQDSWNNLMLAENYHPGLKEKMYNFLKQAYLKKWLNQSLFIATITPAFADFIQKITSKKIEVITNGFGKDTYALKNIEPSNSVFNISVMGTIHPIQDISVMIKGLNQFLQNKDSKKIQLNFIGLEAFPEMSKKISNSVNFQNIHITPRVTMEKAVELTLSSHILLFPSYKGYKGYYTAKIFEYLGARRNILMVPGNNDIVDDLILKTNAGKIVNSETEFSSTLENWFAEWKNTGKLKYEGIDENINFYSRENQNKLFCKAIEDHLV